MRLGMAEEESRALSWEPGPRAVSWPLYWPRARGLILSARGARGRDALGFTGAGEASAGTTCGFRGDGEASTARSSVLAFLGANSEARGFFPALGLRCSSDSSFLLAAGFLVVAPELGAAEELGATEESPQELAWAAT